MSAIAAEASNSAAQESPSATVLIVDDEPGNLSVLGACNPSAAHRH